MNVPNSKKFVNSVSRRKTKYKRNTDPISDLSLVQIHVQYHSLLFWGVGTWPMRWGLEPYGGRPCLNKRGVRPESCNLTSRNQSQKTKWKNPKMAEKASYATV